MKENTGLISEVHGKFEPDYDIIIGYKIKAGAVTKQQRVLQIIGLPAKILVVNPVPSVNKNVQVQSVKNLPKLIGPDKADIFDLLGDDGKFYIIFKYDEMLGINQVILVRADNVAVVANALQHEIRLCAGRYFPVNTGSKIYPWI